MLHALLISIIAPVAAEAPSGIAVGITLMFVGMTVVFTSLLLIWGMIALMHRLFGSDSTPPTPAPSAPAAAPPPSTQSALSSLDDELSPELIAVITAAAVAVLRKPLQIRRVSLVRPNADSASAWLAGGRTRLMGSHSPTRTPHH